MPQKAEPRDVGGGRHAHRDHRFGGRPVEGGHDANGFVDIGFADVQRWRHPNDVAPEAAFADQ